MKYRSFLFDWSGTLVDDLPPTLFATNAVLEKFGVAPMGREEFRRRFRLPYPEFYDEVLPSVPIEDLEDTFRSSFGQSPKGVTVLPHARRCWISVGREEFDASFSQAWTKGSLISSLVCSNWVIILKPFMPG